MVFSAKSAIWLKSKKIDFLKNETQFSKKKRKKILFFLIKINKTAQDERGIHYGHFKANLFFPIFFRFYTSPSLWERFYGSKDARNTWFWPLKMKYKDEFLIFLCLFCVIHSRNPARNELESKVCDKDEKRKKTRYRPFFREYFFNFHVFWQYFKRRSSRKTLVTPRILIKWALYLCQSKRRYQR